MRSDEADVEVGHGLARAARCRRPAPSRSTRASYAARPVGLEKTASLAGKRSDTIRCARARGKAEVGMADCVTDEAEIRQLIDKLIEAIRAMDIEGVMRI